MGQTVILPISTSLLRNPYPTLPLSQRRLAINYDDVTKQDYTNLALDVTEVHKRLTHHVAKSKKALLLESATDNTCIKRSLSVSDKAKAIQTLAIDYKNA